MTREQILAELAVTRAALAVDTATVRRELDFKAKANAIVRRNPFAWFGGAAILGWWLAGPKRKTRTVTKVVDRDGRRVKSPVKRKAGRFGLLLALFRLAFPYIQPVLSSYATDLLGKYVGGHPVDLPGRRK